MTINGRAGMRDRLQRAASFFQHDAAGGIVLFLAAALALALENSPLAWLSGALLDTPLSIRLGQLSIDKPLLLWINDGLMAIFFFLVGLEIKRELLVGELSTREQAILPLIAAVGGMALPAAIYSLINLSDSAALHGWAIPAATDIAFSVGVLSLVGSRAPPALKAFLLALAIIDDVGSIVIIALFYTHHLSLYSLGLALLGIAVLWLLNWRNVASIAAYVLTGIFIWVCVLKSGVHATLAGVAVALAVPLYTSDGQYSPLQRLEHALEPWVVFGVLPLFAFANAGVSLAGITFAKLLEPVPLGIVLGLVVGKSVGIFGATWAAVRWGLASWPVGASRMQVLGVSLLGGIGFTMSLFIGMLAFTDATRAAELRLGVLTGSLISATLGYLVLRWAKPSDPA